MSSVDMENFAARLVALIFITTQPWAHGRLKMPPSKRIRYAESWQGESSDGLMLVHLYPAKESGFHQTEYGPTGCRCEPTIDFMLNKHGRRAIRIARHQKVL